MAHGANERCRGARSGSPKGTGPAPGSRGHRAPVAFGHEGERRAGPDSDVLDRLEDDDEVCRVYELLTRHLVLTGSTIGDCVLQSWPSMRHKLIAVMPRDFKRVRAEEAARAKAQALALGDLVGA